jgi:hypothetical protein
MNMLVQAKGKGKGKGKGRCNTGVLVGTEANALGLTTIALISIASGMWSVACLTSLLINEGLVSAVAGFLSAIGVIG